jgi:hypothetical protein
MPVFPIRGLSKYGVVSDVEPYSLPPEAFSGGNNVRFHNGTVVRAPVFRTVETGMLFTDPRFVSSNTPTSGYDSVILGYLNGRVTSFKNGTETDVSIASYVNNNSEAAFTACHLSNIYYVNRSDRAPWSFGTSDTQFHVLANWPATYSANLLRACGSALIAFGITKAGVAYPTMVKTSEFALANAVPANWDPTLTNTNARENILAEMEGSITDANNLGEAMVIYGLNETWAMTADGSTNVWAFHRLFTDAGAINANCSLEIDRKHFVFGLNDIWVHDGNTKQSICDGRVREFIFSGININAANRCHVVHDQARKEVRFHYVSGDSLCSFLGTAGSGCNRAAVYSLVDKTWSFDDLPFVFSAWRANVNSLLTYATVTSTYDTIGGSYLDQDDNIKKGLVMVGDVSSTYTLTQSLYVVDPQGPGSAFAFPVDTKATKGWTLVRDGIDLDEVGASLSGYKVVNTIYPQARLEQSALPLTFEVGAADFFSNTPVMDTPQTYDGNSLYKLDFNMPGRYLFIRITHPDYHYVSLAGFDLDIDVLGDR